jgi:hypothetical protein
VADTEDELTVGAFYDLGGESLFLVFERLVFDFDQFMLVESGFERGEKGVRETGFADFQDGFEVLSSSFEGTQGWASEFVHGGVRAWDFGSVSGEGASDLPSDIGCTRY